MANTDIEAVIYNGAHKLTFKNGGHLYYVDGVLCPGVTTIIGAVLAKDGLMLWPLSMAIKHLKSKVPGHVTDQDLEDAKEAHKLRRDAGASTGTIVHQLVEKVLLNESVTVVDEYSSLYPEEVMKPLLAFVSWYSDNRPRPVAVEQVVYSQEYGVAGTFDFIVRLGNKTYLCDLKTTNASSKAPRGVYAENFIQLGAYYAAYEEQRQWELAHGGTDLIEIDDLAILSCRKDGKVTFQAASGLGLSLDDCKELWTCTIRLYQKLKNVTVKLRGL